MNILSPKSCFQFFAGEFQPLTKAATEALRARLDDSLTTYVIVRPKTRSKNSPFSFEEVKAMFEAAFPGDKRLYIEQSDSYIHAPIYGAVEISWPLKGSINEFDTEEMARTELCCLKPHFVPTIDFSVAEAIDDFAPCWKTVLRS